MGDIHTVINNYGVLFLATNDLNEARKYAMNPPAQMPDPQTLNIATWRDGAVTGHETNREIHATMTIEGEVNG